jgi:hypothetical protein
LQAGFSWTSEGFLQLVFGKFFLQHGPDVRSFPPAADGIPAGQAFIDGHTIRDLDNHAELGTVDFHVDPGLKMKIDGPGSIQKKRGPKAICLSLGP